LILPGEMPGLFVGEDETELSDVLVLPTTLTRNRGCEFCPKCSFEPRNCGKDVSSGHYVTNAPA